MSHTRYRLAQQGLSLLELLVAFAIMALSIGLLYRSMGSSARSVADMAQQQQAALVAESVLALRDSVTAEGWNETGTSAGFGWVVRSAPFSADLPWPAAPDNAPPPTTEPIPLHQVSLTVFWSDGSRPRQLDLTTLLPQRKPFAGEAQP
jgi:general secretion pathway protein I